MAAPRWLALALTAATAAACSSGSSSAPAPPDRRDAATSAPPDARPDAAPPPASLGPGPAYLGVDGVGLVRLEGGQVTRVIDSPLGFRAIAIGRDGVVYAASISGLWQIGAGPSARIDEGDSSFTHLALGPDGVVWALGIDGLSRWDGRTWTREPDTTFDDPVFRDLVVDLDGRVWVVTPDRLWRLDGDHWTGLDGGFVGRDRPFFWSAALTPDGTVLVTSMSGIFAYADGGWRDTNLGPRSAHVDELTIGSGGHLAARVGLADLVFAAPGSGARRVRLGDDVVEAAHARLLAVDHQGRAWLSTDGGVVIVGPDGGLLQQWPPGTVEGIDGTVTAAAVIGDGPELPTLRPARTGTVTGRILRRRKPAARAEIELCESPMIVYTDTPCEGFAVRRHAVAGADGRFRVRDVPVGTFGFAIKTGARWQVVLVGPDCCSALGKADSIDVGVVQAD